MFLQCFHPKYCRVSVIDRWHHQSGQGVQDLWTNGQSEYIWWHSTRYVLANMSHDTIINYNPTCYSSCYTLSSLSFSSPCPPFMLFQTSNTLRMRLMSSGTRRALFSLCGSSNTTRPKDCLSLPSAGRFAHQLCSYTLRLKFIIILGGKM